MHACTEVIILLVSGHHACMQVNATELEPEHAYIQITHVEPYFLPEDLERRKTKFERTNNISRFVFETPFTKDGKSRGDVTKQCMRKTILTSELAYIQYIWRYRPYLKFISYWYVSPYICS